MTDDRLDEEARKVWQAIEIGAPASTNISAIAAALRAERKATLEEAFAVVNRIMLANAGGKSEMALAAACDAIRSLPTPTAVEGEEK